MVNFTTEELKLIRTVIEAFADPDAVADHYGVSEEEASDLINGILRKLN